MDMLKLAQTRYTAKHYDPSRKLDDRTIESLAEILRLSASSVNIQPWRFFFIRSAEAKARLMPAVKDFNIDRVKDAPLIVLFCAENEISGEHLDRLVKKEIADGRYGTAVDVGSLDALRRTAVAEYCETAASTRLWTHEQVMLAMGSFLTSVAGMGLDATCLGGFFFDRVDEIFGFKDKGLHLVVGCAVGYHLPSDANATRPKSRFALEDVVEFL